MKASFAAVVAVVAWAAIPALATASGSEATHHHFRYAHHHVRKPPAKEAVPPSVATAPGATPSPPFLQPLEGLGIAPFPPGQGDTDGLSRDAEDCNKGCIDN
jgi:hypothetical protein